MEGVDPELIMHGQLNAPKGFVLMGSDTPPQMDRSSGSSITVCLSGDDVDDLRGYFEALSEGGEVSMALEKQMWGDYYGALTDRFGVPWMANISGGGTAS
jgi:PhnB protein